MKIVSVDLFPLIKSLIKGSSKEYTVDDDADMEGKWNK